MFFYSRCYNCCRTEGNFFRGIAIVISFAFIKPFFGTNLTAARAMPFAGFVSNNDHFVDQLL